MPSLAVVSTMLDAIMNELRIPITNLTERTKIQAQMSYVYNDICAKQDWWWLIRKFVTRAGPIVTDQVSGSNYFTGGPTTVSVVEGSPTITWSGTPLVDMTNTVIFVTATNPTSSVSAGDFGAPARIATSTVGVATATLDGYYSGGTDTAAEFVMYRDLYELPADCAKLLRLNRWGYRASDARRIGFEEMSALKIQDRRVGPPEWYTIYDFATTGTASTARLLWIHPYPDKNYRLEVWYKHQSPGDLSDIALPTDYQQVLNYGTLSRCYPIFLNDLDRGQYYLRLFNDVMDLMANQQREYASDKPGINPSADLYRTRQSRRRAGSLGALFDIFPSQP